MSVVFFLAGCCFAGITLGAVANKLELGSAMGLIFIVFGGVLTTGLLSRVFL
jgi:hypothetical protein